jgi:uncharacterized membrane protein YcaP (DUF421 family)
MEDYLVILFRTLLFYILILIIFRFMGKREIGELSLLDLVVFIMIAEMAAVGVDKTEDSIFRAITPMLFLLVIQVSLALFSLKSKKFRDIVDGQPSIIIKNGKIDEGEMRKQRYNFDDLLLQMREKNIRNIADVEFAILETSGKLSVFEKPRNTNESERGGITIPLIMDGEIQESNLGKINKTNLWLRQRLREKGFQNIKDISFCSYQNGEFYIDLKDEK